MTFNDYSVIIPHFGKNDFRLRNLKYVVQYYKKALPDATIYVAEQNGDGSLSHILPDVIYKNINIDHDKFSKSELLTKVINENVVTTYIIMVDNDCILSEDGIKLLHGALDNCSVFIPFRSINILNEGHTRQLVRDGEFLKIVKRDRMHVSRYTGGFNLFTKQTFDTVGGFDDEFRGWGAEDDAFLTKCERLCGPVLRTQVNIELIHMFHPKEDKPEYLKSDNYNRNKKFVACLKRMSIEDLRDYVNQKRNGNVHALQDKVNKYDVDNKLAIMCEVHVGSGVVSMDTTAYNIIPDKTGCIGLENILQAIYNCDGKEFVLNVIDQIEAKIFDCSDNDKLIIDRFKNMP